MTFTSFPIMWYAVFDFECERDRKEIKKDKRISIVNSNEDESKNYLIGDEHLFMKNPFLYKIGMESRCFSKLDMLCWIVYGLWHALVVFYVCFWALCACNT